MATVVQNYPTELGHRIWNNLAPDIVQQGTLTGINAGNGAAPTTLGANANSVFSRPRPPQHQPPSWKVSS